MSAPRDSAISFEAVKTAIRQDRNGYTLILSIHPNDVPDQLLRSWVGSRYQVALVQIGDDERPFKPVGKIPEGFVEGSGKFQIDKPDKISHTEGERMVALAGELCRTPSFQKWIGASSEEDAARQLREMLGIESRKELLENESHQEAFQWLFSNYQDDTGIRDSGIPD